MRKEANSRNKEQRRAGNRKTMKERKHQPFATRLFSVWLTFHSVERHEKLGNQLQNQLSQNSLSELLYYFPPLVKHDHQFQVANMKSMKSLVRHDVDQHYEKLFFV
jgi:hypothetical protein